MKETKRKGNFWITVGFFAFLLVLQVIVLSACGTTAGTDDNKNPSNNQTQPSETTTDPTKTSDAAPEQLAKSCATGCHEMAPEVATWQLSAHSQFDCTTCHEVSKEDQQAKHDSGDFTMPIKIATLITNDVCQKCHSKNRQASPSGDLIIPHDKHEAQGVPCVKCHAGVVHAKVAERHIVNQAGFDDLSKWTPVLAEKIATDYYYTPDMWTCINCHKSLSVTTKCNVCHTTIPNLPSHDQPIWKVKHGITARQNIGDCTKCHSKPDAPKKLEPSTGDLAADIARLNEYCFNCHTKKPESHNVDMRRNHPSIAVERGLQNCFSCHNTEQPAVSENVTGTYCNQCHWFTKKNPAPVAKQ